MDHYSDVKSTFHFFHILLQFLIKNPVWKNTILPKVKRQKALLFTFYFIYSINPFSKYDLEKNLKGIFLIEFPQSYKWSFHFWCLRAFSDLTGEETYYGNNEGFFPTGEMHFTLEKAIDQEPMNRWCIRRKQNLGIICFFT